MAVAGRPGGVIAAPSMPVKGAGTPSGVPQARLNVALISAIRTAPSSSVPAP